MELRLCMLYVVGVIDMRPDHVNEKSVLGGLASTLLQLASGFNVTYVFPDVNHMGALIDQENLKYDGCLGSLQKNESDLAIIAPVDGYYGPTVQPWMPVWADFALIGTVYQKTEIDVNKVEKTHVLEFLKAYACINWILTIASLIVLATAITASMFIRRKMRRDISNLIQESGEAMFEPGTKLRLRKIGDKVSKMVISCVLKQHSNTGRLTSSSVSFLYAIMTALCLFTTYFLTSMIKTEMVVIKRPITYESYQDLLDNGTAALWLDELDDQRNFRDAPHGSTAKKIWDRAVKQGIRKSVVTTDKLQDIPWILSMANEVVSKKRVSLSNSAFTAIVLSNACLYIRSEGMFNNVNAYIRRDESAVENIRSLPGSSLAHPLIKERISRVGRWFTETDPIIPMFIRRYGSFLVPNGGEKYFSAVEECKSNVIVMPHVDLLPVTLFHFRDLQLVCFIAITLSLAMLMIEKRAKNSKRN